MRKTVLLLTLITVSSIVAMGQTKVQFKNAGDVPFRTSLGTPCRGEDLSLKEGDTDAAMGGVRVVIYTFTNKSSAACTIYGYPSYRVFDRRGRLLPHGQAVRKKKLISDETSYALQLITIEPGKTAWFRVYYNAGGAGYMGKPCPVGRRIKIVAPGTTRVFVFRTDLSLCSDLQVSSVRGGSPE